MLHPIRRLLAVTLAASGLLALPAAAIEPGQAAP